MAPPAVEAVLWAYVAGRRWRCWAACLRFAPWACWGSPWAQITGSTWRRASSFLSTRPQTSACHSTPASGGCVSWLVSKRRVFDHCSEAHGLGSGYSELVIPLNLLGHLCCSPHRPSPGYQGLADGPRVELQKSLNKGCPIVNYWK